MSARPGPEDPTTPERPAEDAPRAAVEPWDGQAPGPADVDRPADEETTPSGATVPSATDASTSDGTTAPDGERVATESSPPEARSSGARTGSPEDPEQIAVRAGSVRRAPVYRRFFLMGALLGTVIALVLSPFGDFAASDQVRALLPMPWGLVMFALPFGGLLGLLVALILDRRSRRPPHPARRPARGAGPTDRR